MKGCESQIQDMHIWMKNLVKGASKLEKDLNDLRAQSQQISEANRQKVIKEYKASPELAEASTKATSSPR